MMLQRRAKSAGIITRMGNHTFRATGVTAYLKNGGPLERAAQMARGFWFDRPASWPHRDGRGYSVGGATISWIVP
jgi:hypothetical protein